jgi:hypothetical protein
MNMCCYYLTMGIAVIVLIVGIVLNIMAAGFTKIGKE